MHVLHAQLRATFFIHSVDPADDRVPNSDGIVQCMGRSSYIYVCLTGL